MDREIKKIKDDIDDLWEAHKKHKEFNKNTAKLAVFTAREQERLASRFDVVVFLEGSLKDKVEKKFKEYKAENKGRKGKGKGSGSSSRRKN